MSPYENNYCSHKNMGDEKSIFTTNDNQVTTTTANDNSTSSDDGGPSIGQGSGFSPLAAPFQSLVNMDLKSMNMMPQEPLVGDTAPSNLSLDFMNLRVGDSDSLYDDRAGQNNHNYFIGSRTESVASPAPASGNIWTDNNHSINNSNINKNSMIELFLKTFASANTYASMLTREQTLVLKDIRPDLIYEFLHEVIRIRSEKRMQRALPNECAFCKNNGENEESYSSHALKDWKGRVQCPVLRAFRCPRCGATGDRAHTIKYCNAIDHGQGPFQRRGRNWFGESTQANYGAATPSFSAQSNLAQSNPAQSNLAQSNSAPSDDSTSSFASFWSNLGKLNQQYTPTI